MTSPITSSRRVPSAALVVAAFVCLLVPLLVFVTLFNRPSVEDCIPPQPDVALAADITKAGLRRAQLVNAATVIAVGNRMGIPRHGIVIGLAVASQESRFLNYANDGRGDDLAYSQRGIEASLNLPHQAVGTDHGSLGIFQQQWPWWGNMAELMDPATATEKFYTALLEVAGWEQMPVTVAGQAVQRSAYPDAYADDEALAISLLADTTVTSPTIDASVLEASCAPRVAAASVVVSPLPARSGYVDRANWGGTGDRWERGHTGTDLSVACGTPVLAAHAGTVIVRTDQPWSGPWLVQVTTGPGRLTTWYAHMQQAAVADGDPVTPGQVIGAVGAEGNSTGCHLHFEVHPTGGSIYDDNVNPTAWLSRYVGRTLADGIRPASTKGGEFTVATFNVLGHSHTRRGGNKPGWASSATRIRWTVQLLDQHGVDVVGLQEFQMPQRRRMLALAGDRYAVYSPPGDPQDSIAWRRDRFVLVAAETFKIPYFVGQRPMPVVQLRDRVTRRDTVFVSVHNPASVRRFGDLADRRAEGLRRELAVVQGLVDRGHHVVLMGDFNEKKRTFCKVTHSGRLHASAGGSHDGTCRPPRRSRIDWIFATRDIAFTGHLATRTALVARTSDHPFVVAQVRHSQ